MTWELLESCASKEEADEKLHHYAATVRAVWDTERFGVAVRRVAGTWGVWLKDRHPEEKE